MNPKLDYNLKSNLIDKNIEAQAIYFKGSTSQFEQMMHDVMNIVKNREKLLRFREKLNKEMEASIQKGEVSNQNITQPSINKGHLLLRSIQAQLQTQSRDV